MKRKISFILAVIMLVSLFTGVVSAADLPAGKVLNTPFYSWDCAGESTKPYHYWFGGAAAFDEGTVKLSGDDYTALFICTGGNSSAGYNLKKDSSYVLSYKVKGNAGDSFSVDGDPYNSAFTGLTGYTIQQSDVWEEVSCLFTFNGDNPPATDSTAYDNGYAIRFYDVDDLTYYIDDIKIAEVIDDPNYTPSYTDLTKIDATKDGGYVKLQNSGADADTYTAFYYTLALEAKEYTVSAKFMANTAVDFNFDLEDLGGVADVPVSITEAEKETWVEKTFTFTPDSAATFPARFYWFADNTDKQLLMKEIVIKDADGKVVGEFTGKTAPADPPFRGTDFRYVAVVSNTPAPKLTNILELESVKSRDYMLFENTAAAPNAGYYMRAKLNKGEEYTLSFDVLSNNADVEILTDLEFPVAVTGVSTQGGKVSKVDTWETVTYKFTTNAKWEECNLGDGQTAVHGWPLRIYTAGAMDAQTAIDNIVVKDSNGKVVLSQDFKKSGLGDIPTWGIGKYTHIPLGFVPEQEGEVLGYNEIVNGDFEDSSLMSYWWFRTDWNGGIWKAEAGKGYDGSVGLVAYGKGEGAADQNNGCFYTLYGEGKEATLDLIEGKTYVLKYKVFRPEGVDSYTYIDINEGGVTNGTATKNGEWETVTTRFVAPAGALKIRLVVNALAEGEYVIFDDIEIRQVGGDPNGNPKTADNMVLGAVVAAMTISVAGVAIISKKRILSK